MKILNLFVGTALAVAAVMVLRAPTAPPQGNLWFDAVIARESRPVVVKFGADWCGPCHHMDGVLDQYSSSRVKVVRIDIDEKPELAEHFGVHTIPRVFLFKNGYAVASHGGFGNVQQLESWVNSRL